MEYRTDFYIGLNQMYVSVIFLEKIPDGQNRTDKLAYTGCQSRTGNAEL